MEFKDYYAALGVERTATPAEIKRAYRKLARKYHPDVSKEADAEARFKEVAEAHEALIDAERRAAYDAIAQRHAAGQPFEPPPGWDSGFEFSGRGQDEWSSQRARGAGDGDDFGDFFESLFGRHGSKGPYAGRHGGGAAKGRDHHAKLAIALRDALQGAQRTMTLQLPMADERGRTTLHERHLDVHIPAGVRTGQHLRLAGQGGPGEAGAAAGDLYLEIQILPDPVFRLDGADIYFDLPVAPWEAALGATVTAPTPDGRVQLNVPPGSPAGRKLRLKGKGLPGRQPGDLYAVLTLVLPSAASEPEKDAYGALSRAFPTFNPRAALET